MKQYSLPILAFFMAFSTAALADTVVIPGTADIWLAGMPDGSTASAPPAWKVGAVPDEAPDQSPILVTGLPIVPGESLYFSATGLVINEAGIDISLWNDPDGGVWKIHDAGPENGISNIVAPLNSLLGVFLGSGQPDLTPAPGPLNFSSPSFPTVDYPTLIPELKQVFFIGDGWTSGPNPFQHQIIIPSDATRLYLGTMDGHEWNNNLGSFRVNVSPNPVPEPGSVILLGTGLAGLGFVTYRRKRKSQS